MQIIKAALVTSRDLLKCHITSVKNMQMKEHSQSLIWALVHPPSRISDAHDHMCSKSFFEAILVMVIVRLVLRSFFFQWTMTMHVGAFWEGILVVVIVFFLPS